MEMKKGEGFDSKPPSSWEFFRGFFSIAPKYHSTKSFFRYGKYLQLFGTQYNEKIMLFSK